MRKLGSALMTAAALMLGLGLATQANATAFTLADTITLSDPNSGLDLLLHPDYTVSGATNCLAGTCTLTNDFVVFTAEVLHGTPLTDPDVDEIGASVFATNFIEGWGLFTAPPGVVPSGKTGAPPTTQAIWDFDAPKLTDGDLSKPLFVTYVGSLNFVGGGQTINFMVHPVGGADFSSPAAGPSGALVIVPEPSTLALTAAMLAALAALGRRQH